MCINEKHTYYNCALKLSATEGTSSFQPTDQPKKRTRNKEEKKKGKKICTKVECVCKPPLPRHSSIHLFGNISGINPSNSC